MKTQVDLFGEIHLPTPNTEGIKYAGSKLKIIPYILDVVSGLNVKSILDGFSGTTRVSQTFAQQAVTRLIGLRYLVSVIY